MPIYKIKYNAKRRGGRGSRGWVIMYGTVFTFSCFHWDHPITQKKVRHEIQRRIKTGTIIEYKMMEVRDEEKKKA
jgi:hypothetical protein